MTAGMQGSSKIHFGKPEGEAATVPPTAEPKKIARYQVVGCPKPPNAQQGYRVVLGGSISFFADGKIVDENIYDVEALQRQGVKLEKIGEF
jgi:hypothetical protein